MLLEQIVNNGEHSKGAWSQFERKLLCHEKKKQAKNLITRQKGIDHERFQHECIHGNEGEVDTLLRQRGYQAPTPHKHFFWNACFDVLSHFLHGPQKKKKKNQYLISQPNGRLGRGLSKNS